MEAKPKKKPVEQPVELTNSGKSLANFVVNTPRHMMRQMTRIPKGSHLQMSSISVIKHIGDDNIDLLDELEQSICAYGRSVPIQGESNTLMDIMATLAAEEAPEEDEGKTIRPI
jgi:hypothetical protein